MINVIRKPTFKCTSLIFLCFLLTSTGHLSWMYHLMTMTDAHLAQQICTVAGYASQAIGIGVFALLIKRSAIKPRTVLLTSLIAYAVLLIPSVLGTDPVGTAVFGILLSLFCGVIAGCYLHELCVNAPDDRRAAIFGVGYGAATIVSWLFSLIDNGSVYYGSGVLIICLIMTVLTVLCAFIKTDAEEQIAKNIPAETKPRLQRLLILVCGVVLVFSMVNNIGFSFSPAEVQGGLRPEFARIFYAVGLVAAGFVTDKSRKYGAVCALAALAIPFIELALRGEPISSSVFWALGYFAFGFYAVYRVILFSDIAKSRGLLYLSGAGLPVGRVGDALGTELNLLFAGHEAVSVVFAAALFVAAIFLFIRLFQYLYIPAAVRQKTEQEIFADFAARHDLSGREREVLRLLLEDKTNKEISEVICVSESTVKFHIHNLLSKTGCKSRTELKNVYHTNRED